MSSWVTWCKSQVCQALCLVARSGDTAVLPAMKAWCTPYTLSVAGNESWLKGSCPFKRKVRELLYTWNPNDPCFDWKRPSFGGCPKIEDKQVPGKLYICVWIYLNDTCVNVSLYIYMITWPFSKFGWDDDNFPCNVHWITGIPFHAFPSRMFEISFGIPDAPPGPDTDMSRTQRSVGIFVVQRFLGSLLGIDGSIIGNSCSCFTPPADFSLFQFDISVIIMWKCGESFLVACCEFTW